MPKHHIQRNGRAPRLPPLLRFLALHFLLGSAIGVAFVSLLVMTNVAGLHDLLIEAEDPMLPLLLLYAFNVFTFSSATMGIAVMMLPGDEGR
jgi:hypothetical protein